MKASNRFSRKYAPNMIRNMKKSSAQYEVASVSWGGRRNAKKQTQRRGWRWTWRATTRREENWTWESTGRTRSAEMIRNMKKGSAPYEVASVNWRRMWERGWEEHDDENKSCTKYLESSNTNSIMIRHKIGKNEQVKDEKIRQWSTQKRGGNHSKAAAQHIVVQTEANDWRRTERRRKDVQIKGAEETCMHWITGI